ncbi:MAG: Dabb family protein [Planctomycetota bacterium]
MIRAAALAAAVGAAACGALRSGEGEVDRVMLLWWKTPADRASHAHIERVGSGFVGRVPGLTRVSVGRPLLDDPQRELDHDAALVLNFVDRAALTAFVEHPAHARAVMELLAPHVERVQIYDVLLR